MYFSHVCFYLRNSFLNGTSFAKKIFARKNKSAITTVNFLKYSCLPTIHKRNEIKTFKFGLLPFLIIVGFVGCPLIIQNDIGTLGIISITGLNARAGLEGRIELFLTAFSKITKKN